MHGDGRRDGVGVGGHVLDAGDGDLRVDGVDHELGAGVGRERVGGEVHAVDREGVDALAGEGHRGGVDVAGGGPAGDGGLADLAAVARGRRRGDVHERRVEVVLGNRDRGRARGVVVVAVRRAVVVEGHLHGRRGLIDGEGVAGGVRRMADDVLDMHGGDHVVGVVGKGERVLVRVTRNVLEVGRMDGQDGLAVALDGEDHLVVGVLLRVVEERLGDLDRERAVVVVVGAVHGVAAVPRGRHRRAGALRHQLGDVGRDAVVIVRRRLEHVARVIRRMDADVRGVDVAVARNGERVLGAVVGEFGGEGGAVLVVIVLGGHGTGVDAGCERGEMVLRLLGIALGAIDEGEAHVDVLIAEQDAAMLHIPDGSSAIELRREGVELIGDARDVGHDSVPTQRVHGHRVDAVASGERN